MINQDAQYQDPAQSVSVNATTTFEAVNFAGNTSFDFLPADLVTANQTENAGWGGVANTVLGANAGAAEGVGASLIGAVMNNTTLAMVGGPGTQLNFGNGGFSVTADQEVVQVNIGTSGGLGSSGLGAGGNYGANGTFSNFTADTNTSAQVASGTVVTGDNGTDGAVNVNADDTVLLIAVAGAAFKGENLGIGISGVLNDVTRTTQAIIGTNLDDDATPIVTDRPRELYLEVAGPVTVSATEDGDVVNFALSGSVSTPSTGGPSGSEAAALPSSFGSWGIGISGDASYTDETDTTLAYINDAGTFSTGAMDVSADDKTVLAGFTGSYATASLSDAADQGGTSMGIAGSYSEVDLGGSDEAFIQDAQLTVDRALSVEAERDNYLGTLACSVAGSPVDSSLEVAGSASLSFFSGDTEAYLAGVSGSVDGALTVTAEDDTIYVAIGGPVTSAGSGGPRAFVRLHLGRAYPRSLRQGHDAHRGGRCRSRSDRGHVDRLAGPGFRLLARVVQLQRRRQLCGEHGRDDTRGVHRRYVGYRLQRGRDDQSPGQFVPGIGLGRPGHCKPVDGLRGSGGQL